MAKTKEELSLKKLSNTTMHNKVSNAIRDLGSRQEFEPVLGRLIDKAYAEPLHNSNNAWQLLQQAVVKSNIPTSCTDVSSLSLDSPFRKFLFALKDDVKASRLYKKVLIWFKSGRTKKFEYHFTGKDARLLSHNFMYLIPSLTLPHDSKQSQLRLATLAFCCLKLRDAVSLFSRIVVGSASIIRDFKKMLFTIFQCFFFDVGRCQSHDMECWVCNSFAF